MNKAYQNDQVETYLFSCVWKWRCCSCRNESHLVDTPPCDHGFWGLVTAGSAIYDISCFVATLIPLQNASCEVVTICSEKHGCCAILGQGFCEPSSIEPDILLWFTYADGQCSSGQPQLGVSAADTPETAFCGNGPLGKVNITQHSCAMTVNASSWATPIANVYSIKCIHGGLVGYSDHISATCARPGSSTAEVREASTCFATVHGFVLVVSACPCYWNSFGPPVSFIQEGLAGCS